MTARPQDAPVHMLFFAFSRSSLGHVVRTTVAARHALACGHGAVVACHESVRHVPERAGVPWRGIDEIAPAPAWRGLDDPQRLRAFVRTRLAGAEYIERSLHDELAAIDAVRPDVVIADMRNTAGVAASLRGLPSCSLHNLRLFQHPMHVMLPEILSTLRSLGVDEAHARKVLGETLLVPDVPELDRLSDVPADAVALICSLVQQIRHVGPLIDGPSARGPRSPTAATPHDRPAHHVPRVVVMLGGSGAGDHEIDRVVAALAGLDVQVEVVLGVRAANADVTGVQAHLATLKGDDAVVVSGYRADAAELLAASDAAVVHGGHQSMLEGLLCATPLVFLPHSLEQRHNARRVEELGLGTVITADTGADEVRSALLRALDMAGSCPVTRFAAALRDAGGGARLVDTVVHAARIRRALAPVQAVTAT